MNVTRAFFDAFRRFLECRLESPRIAIRYRIKLEYDRASMPRTLADSLTLVP